MYSHYHTADEVFSSAACGDYRLLLAWPDEPAPAGGWPVFYLLDGAQHFPVAAHLMQTLARPRCCMLPGVVVAIGYLDGTRRERDYRPALTHPVPEANPRGGYYPLGEAGQADTFLAFIQQELKPTIARRFPIDAQRQGLFGHSYGGLFTLYTLFTQSATFAHYYASSPSVWWNQSYIVQLAEQCLLTQRPSATLLLSVGEHEQSLERWELALPDDDRLALQQHRRQRRMVEGVRELAWRLQAASLEPLQVSLVVHAGQSHQSVPLLALQQAMMHHFMR